MYKQPKNRDLGVNTCLGCLDKQREIDRLKEEVRQLKAKLNYRQQQQQQQPFGSSTPSSKVSFKPNAAQVKGSNQGGAKTGHIGHGRTSIGLEQAHRVVNLASTSACPQCGELLQDKGSRLRTVLDSPSVKVEKVVYRIEKKYCRFCRKTVEATMPGVLAKSLFSNQLITDILSSHYLHGEPLGRIAARLRINLGSIIDVLHRMAALFRGVVEHLIQDYRSAPVRQADETGWRTDGRAARNADESGG